MRTSGVAMLALMAVFCTSLAQELPEARVLIPLSPPHMLFSHARIFPLPPAPKRRPALVPRCLAPMVRLLAPNRLPPRHVVKVLHVLSLCARELSTHGLLEEMCHEGRWAATIGSPYAGVQRKALEVSQDSCTYSGCLRAASTIAAGPLFWGGYGS